jgi:4-hydroxyphenylpyruvate dioxygenase
MNSKVVQNSTGSIKFPMMEPAPGKRKSQIDEYLSYHHGPGAQHVALLTDDIVKAVRVLNDSDIEFLNTPRSYYSLLSDRIGRIDEDVADLRDLNILVDRDKWGYLMQVFAKPVQGRPTAFLEIIQRKGARGFGSGNVRALFEALEHEQELRGNL